MTEHRPLHRQHPEDELVELALGDVGEPDRSRLIQHLITCDRCRSQYEELLDAVDAVLPAAPVVAPPIGFEQRALEAMGVTDGPQARPSGGRLRRPRVRLFIAAAAAIVAAVLGGVVGITVWDDDSETPQVASDMSPLRTADGDVVGFAAVRTLGDQQALIVSVNRSGARGVGYLCRILYADGHTSEPGHPWSLDDPGGSTWIEAAPAGRIVGMELVTDDGRVWASADLS